MNILIHRAIEFATIKHRDQKRKGTNTPYIVHPMEVFGILAYSGCDEKTIIAGILHDTLEDTDTEYEEISIIFGKEVADIVASESEDKSKTWQERKQATIDNLKNAPLASKHVACADKLSNLISIYADSLTCGEAVWNRFGAGKDNVAWYYEGVINSLAGLKDFAPYILLKEYFNKIFI